MKITWDDTGKRLYETGVDRGVLFPMESGAYQSGVAWNGLTGVTDSPSGAEPTKLYADNGTYMTLMSAEEAGLKIEAYTYPDEFAACDGSQEIAAGITIGQQNRKRFGFSYRTLVGNDSDGNDYGYKIHIVYGCLASVSEVSHETVNDDPEAVQFSWDVSADPITVEGYSRPTASVEIDSTKVDADILSTIETSLYGSDSTESTILMPADIIALVASGN